LACASQGYRDQEAEREGTAGPHLRTLVEFCSEWPSHSKKLVGRPTPLKNLILLLAALQTPAAALPIATAVLGSTLPRSEPRKLGRWLRSKLAKHRIESKRAARSLQLRGGRDSRWLDDGLGRIVRTRHGFHEQVFQEFEPQKSRPGENTTFCVQQVQGTGDCLFHAIAIGIAFEDEGCHLDMYDPSLPQRVMDLRQLAVETLTADPHRQLYMEGEEMISTEELLAAVAEQYSMKPEEYTNAMRNKGVWGGGPEILALANALQRPIHVFEPVPAKNGKELQLQLCCALGSPIWDDRPRVCICAADSKFPNCRPAEVKRHGEGGHHFLALLPTHGRDLQKDYFEEELFDLPR